MTNEQLLEKMSKDMQMRNFSKYTYYAYMHKGKEKSENGKQTYRLLCKYKKRNEVCDW